MTTFQSNIKERAQPSINLLEAKYKAYDMPKIQSVERKSLINHQLKFDEIKKIMSNSNLSDNDKHDKLYRELIFLVKENKRTEDTIEDYTKKLKKNTTVQEKYDKDLISLQTKNENAKNYLTELINKNEVSETDNEKKSKQIKSNKEDINQLFKFSFEQVMRKIKDYERQCERNKVKYEKNSHLQEVGEEEQKKILDLNAEIDGIERNLKDYQNQYKEIVRQELGELQNSLTHYKTKLEEQKVKSKELNDAIDDFKKRFIQQSRQMHQNKERQKYLEKEIYRIVEQKNYLEKEIQELIKQRENQLLINENLVEEVKIFKKENAEYTERKKLLEDFIMKHLK